MYITSKSLSSPCHSQPSVWLLHITVRDRISRLTATSGNNWKDRCMHENKNELPRDKTNKMICAPSEDSDQPGHPPSLIRVFAVRMKKPWILSYPLSAQWRLWSDWADVQADLSLRWAHSHFVGFVVSWLKLLQQSDTKSHENELLCFLRDVFIITGLNFIFVYLIDA